MKIFEKIKGMFAKKQSRIERLEELVKDLEKRTFKEKEARNFDFYQSMISSYIWNEKIEPVSLEEEIMELQDKLDALTKRLKITIEKTPTKNSEWVAKPLKIK